MAVRPHLRIGVVSDQDRLDTSPDSVLVTEPSVGSTLRSKGSLYTIVTARPDSGGRPDQASLLVAETIRREYYYDESAGIPICLQKALRSANKRLRHQREGHGIARAAIGVVVAIVRGQELYVATIGDGEAYLVRQARLLTLPEPDKVEGFPTPDDVNVGVWRGELSAGDSLLLVARNLTRVVGTDEIKNALVTLHPQSAVEHLHHLFVAAGGDGSDALLALEVGEVAITRAERKLVPVKPAEPLAGAPDRSPIPLADPLVDAASAVQGGAKRARRAVGAGFVRSVHRLLDRLPRRRTRYRRVVSGVSRRDSQRRVAVAALASLMFLTVLVVGVWFFAGLNRDEPIRAATTADQAVRAIDERIDQVFGGGRNLVTESPDRAQTLLREAWAGLTTAAQAGVREPQLRERRARIAAGLEELYDVHQATSQTLFEFGANVDPTDLVPGPSSDPDSAYVIDRAARSVLRIDLARKTAKPVVTEGEGRGDGIGEPWMLAVGGPDILIVDRSSALWRWRPAGPGSNGAGTLAQIRVSTAVEWGDDITDIETRVTNSDAGLYNLYVVDPSARGIHRYVAAQDGTFPSAPGKYLATAGDVSGYRDLLIDRSVYALTESGIVRHDSGRIVGFQLANPPDHADLRPGHAYRYLAGTSDARTGQFVVWDEQHGRIVVFSRANGTYVGQYLPRAPQPAFQDVRGMYLVEREGQPSILIWANGRRVFQTVLDPAESTAPGPSTSPGRSPAPSRSPVASPSPARTGG